MRISRNAVFAILLMVGLMFVVEPALAQDAKTAGVKVKEGIEQAITGNIGLFLGLGLAILGIWTWVVKQETAAGIMLIIGGVLITISPGVFNSIRGVVDGVVKTTGSNLQTVQQPLN